jgi:mannose-6-phosphate isomerase-like protein (cupin superfamily)
MKIVNALQVPESEDVRKVHDVSAYPLHASEHVVATMIVLQPGEALLRHATPVDAFFYALEGTGVVEVGDERQTIVADMLVDSPARIPHRLLNESDQPFRFLVVKTPRPTEKSRLL